MVTPCVNTMGPTSGARAGHVHRFWQDLDSNLYSVGSGALLYPDSCSQATTGTIFRLARPLLSAFSMAVTDRCRPVCTYTSAAQ